MNIQKVENFSDLKNVKSISWVAREDADGDWYFSPEISAVRFEDDLGQYWELCTYFVAWSEKMAQYNEYIAGRILNSIFHSLGLMRNKWIGVNIGLSEAVNLCRKEFPRDKPKIEHYFLQEEYIF